MRPIPRRPHGLTNNDACHDFRSQATFCQRTHPCRGTQIPGGSIHPDRLSSSFRCGAVAISRAFVAPPHRSAFVRFFVRDARGDAHDLALASRMVRQPSTPPVSHASLRGSQRLRAWDRHRLGRAQRMDRILGGHSISGRIKVAGRWSLVVRKPGWPTTNDYRPTTDL